MLRFFLFILLLFSVVNAEIISGFVRNSADEEPLYEADVYLEGMAMGSSTNKDGYYVISGVKPGKYTLVAVYAGFEPIKEIIDIRPDNNLKRDFSLSETSIELDEVVLTVEKEGEPETKEEIIRNVTVAKMKLNPRVLKTAVSFIQPDVFRSIKTLPGVDSPSDLTANIYVRGGNDDHNLILYDDITIYNPSHMFGIFSTFMPNALRDSKLIKSSYPAEYGGRLGSVLDVRSRDGNKNEFQGDISASFFATEGVLAGPVLNGGFLLAFRRTHLGPILSALEEIEDTQLPDYNFWEGQANIYQDVTEDDRLRFSTFHSTDNMLFDEIDYDLKWGNSAYSIMWNHIFTPKLYSNFRVSYSKFFIEEDIRDIYKYENIIDDYSVKGYFEYYYSNDLKFKLGSELSNFKVMYNRSIDDDKKMDIKQNTLVSSAFLEGSKTWNNIFTIVPGIRFDYNEELKDGYQLMISPRLSMKYMLGEYSSLSLSGGRYYQNLFTVQNESASVVFISNWFSVDETVAPGISDNVTLGYEDRFSIFGEPLKYSVEAYYKDMRNLQTWNNDPITEDEVLTDIKIGESFLKGNAYAYGFELFLEKQLGRLNGNMSYTYSKVKKEIEDEFRGKVTFNANWDMPHNFKHSLNYQFTENFSLGYSFNLKSGKPYSEIIGLDYIVNENGDESYRYIYGERNGSRIGLYNRLDLSANYTFKFENSELLLNFSVINAMNTKNIEAIAYTVDEDGEVEKDEILMLPIVPSLRINYSF
ncbi:MAG: TonB-dependent receptor [Candidatus Delongbacteria bacterium]|nr:TonB-dependent receptor [Candidatus Delongbacteria bacterium]MBN2836278.1 TonB-dependent receptor [Candidatus Delongbacteria bacterium]